jgi:hypothetical protein
VRRVLTVLLVLALVVGSAAPVAAADAGRLRYVTAVYLDDKGGGMREPEAVACNDKSLVVVGDTGRGRLLRYTVEDRTVKPAGEIVASQLSTPIRVQLNSRDEIFVLDGKERRILRFDAGGAFKGHLAPDGVPGGTTIVPRSFKIDRTDHLYVLDVFSSRVLVLDAAGKYQRHLPFPKDHGFFSDLAVDGRGGIYLLDSVKAMLHAAAKDAKEFTPLGRTLRPHLAFPTALAVDARGVLYVVDKHGAGIVMVGQDGAVLGRQLAMGWTEGLLYYPSQLCLNDRGEVFVADRGNNRLQVFSIVR